MNAGYLSAQIHGRLTEVLASRGFVLKGDGFVSKTGGVRHFVGLALTDYEPEFEITIVFGLRVHAAERIFAQFWGASDDRETCSFTLHDVAPEVEDHVVVRDKRMLKSLPWAPTDPAP